MPIPPGTPPQPPKATDVAAEIRHRGPYIGDVALHKMLYFVQAEHLAWHSTPAFRETLEAWEKGPVVADLWRAERYPLPARAAPQPVPGTVSDVITNVLARLGNKSGTQLIDIAHQADPWADATSNGTDVANQVISHEALARFAAKLPPELAEAREHIQAVRNDEPFTPDAPGALDRLLAAHGIN